MRVESIGREVGHPRLTITIDGEPAPYTEELAYYVLQALRSKGYTLDQIADACSVAANTVRFWLSTSNSVYPSGPAWQELLRFCQHVKLW